jgi:hypothetical protein
MPPATTSIMDSLPPSRAGTGSAVNDTVRELGSALGVAILGSALASRYSSSLRGADALTEVPGELQDAAVDNVGAALTVADGMGSAGDGVADAARDAFAGGMQLTLWLAVGVVGLGAIVAAKLLPRPGSMPAPDLADEDSQERVSPLSV